METVYKTYKYRLYPTEAQKVLLDKHFGCVRFLYNLALETKIEAYKRGVNLSCYDLQKQIKDLKVDCEWLNEVSRYALDNSISNLDAAYKYFFKGKGFPNFKKKTNSGSYRVHKDIKISDKLHIPKFQDGIKIVLHRPCIGELKYITISKTNTGKYYACALTADKLSQYPKTNNSIGVDLGIKSFAVTSDNVNYDGPKFLRKSLKRLAVLQRRKARTLKGSNNRKKASLKVSLLHEKIVNQRKHFLHNISNEITNQNDIICVENLAVSNMIKNKNLSLSISDTGWGNFLNQLSYKSHWKGRQLVEIGRFEPSTKMCSKCGNLQPMPLGERIYNCSCGLSIDRDYNAALNIRNLGILRANSLSS